MAWNIQDYMAVASLCDTMMLAVELPNVPRLAKAEEIRNNGDWDDGLERLYLSLLQYRLWICRKDTRSWIAKLAGSFESMSEATTHSESLVDMNYQPGLTKRKQWRKQLVSEPQANYMRRLGIVPPVPCNKGQASQLISYKIASNAIEKARNGVELQIMEGE